MKKNVFALLFASLLLFSCTEETKETTIFEDARINNEKQQWISASISPEIIANQKKISHYEFDVSAFKAFIKNEDIDYVWFDLGLNTENQITFTATGESHQKGTISQLSSKIITTQNYVADFSIFNTVKNVKFENDPILNHILSNNDAYKYLTTMNKAYDDFEMLLDQSGLRVERFGLHIDVIARILSTKNSKSIALFLGKNSNEKLTTVLIAKDKKGQLLLDASNDEFTAARAFDFTKPCPQQCDGCWCPGRTEFSVACCDDDTPAIDN